MNWKSRFDGQFFVKKILHCLLCIAFLENEMRIAASGHKGMPTQAPDAENAQKLFNVSVSLCLFARRKRRFTFADETPMSR
jgi:hypothetical protein